MTVSLAALPTDFTSTPRHHGAEHQAREHPGVRDVYLCALRAHAESAEERPADQGSRADREDSPDSVIGMVLITKMPFACTQKAPKSAKLTRAAEPIAKPFRMAAMVFPLRSGNR